MRPLSLSIIIYTRCKALYNKILEAATTQNMTNQHLSEVNKDIENLVAENKQLHSYVDNPVKDLDFDKSSSKEITQVGKRQERRKLKELKTNIEKALGFAKTFGMVLQNVNFLDDSGLSHTFFLWSTRKEILQRFE